MEVSFESGDYVINGLRLDAQWLAALMKSYVDDAACYIAEGENLILKVVDD